MVRAVLEPPSEWKPTGDGVSGGAAVEAFQEGALAIPGSAFTALVTISGRT